MTMQMHSGPITLPSKETGQTGQYLTESAAPVVHKIVPIPELIKRFPKTRYYGSKRQLLDWLYSKLSRIEFDTALDLFGGTASVSQLFRSMRKEVTYHDAFCFNSDIAATTLSDRVALSRHDLIDILTRVTSSYGIIARNFDGVFFKSEENWWLDGFMENLHESNHSLPQRQLLRYLLYQACLKKRPFNLFHRANLSLRTNTTVKRTFGNQNTWERPFSDHMIEAYDELCISRLIGCKEAEILSPQDARIVPPGYDLVYLDPPYLNLEDRYNRDDYWRRYHFLEGLYYYKEWEERMDLKSDIRLMSTPKAFPTWSRKSTFKHALFELIGLHKNSVVALSYVTNAYPNDSEILDLFESTFSEVEFHSIEHKHALSRSQRRELLWIGYPK